MFFCFVLFLSKDDPDILCRVTVAVGRAWVFFGLGSLASLGWHSGSKY